jgi:hypothetical protein
VQGIAEGIACGRCGSVCVQWMVVFVVAHLCVHMQPAWTVSVGCGEDQGGPLKRQQLWVWF